MPRTANIKRNIKFSVIKFALQIVLQFLMQKFLIDFLGSEYLGINRLFADILGLLNMAELGIGSAIIFSMYKPIAENDIEKIKSLNYLYKKFYYIIASIILVCGLLVIPFLNLIVKGGYPSDINIYVIYLIFLFNTIISYLAAHKKSLLFAYQRYDVENKIKTAIITFLNLSQILSLIIFKDYFYFIVLMPIFTILESSIIYAKANKLFPLINGKAHKIDDNIRKNINKNIYASSIQSVAHQLIYSTDSIIISLYLGASILGVYSSYFLITSALIQFVYLIRNALQGSVGNLVNTQSVEYSYNKYKQINFAFAWFVGFCSICLIILLQDFMFIYLGKKEFILSFAIVAMIVSNFFLREMRMVTLMFREVKGLMKFEKMKPVVEVIVNLTLSIILVQYFGLIGVIIGTTISCIAAPFWWEPYVLFKHYFKRPVSEYFRKYAVYFGVTVIAGVVTYLICSLLPSVSDWGYAGMGSLFALWPFVVKCGICTIVPNVIFFICFYKTNEFKELIEIAKSMFFKKKDIASE